MPCITHPTRGKPLNDAEKEAAQRMREGQSKWFGGPRFIKIKKYGNGSMNSGTRQSKVGKIASRQLEEQALRPSHRPRWANKYL